MRLAYADPPYIGQAKRHYSHDPKCAEVDHVELLEKLSGYDGWALSLSAPSLRIIAPLVPEEARFCAWVKPFASFKPNVNPGYAWEPVIVKPCRKLGRDVPTVRDWVSANITLKRGLAGAKPAAFCEWLFRFMAAEAGDTLDDLYPGTGAVSAAWARFMGGGSQTVLELPPLTARS